MKHIYLSLSLALLLSFNMQSQILSQDFEDATMSTDPSLGWSQSSIGSPSYGWFFDTAAAFIITGERSAITYGSNDDWLISPSFTLTSGQEIEVSFNYRTNPNSPTETADVNVYIGTDNTPGMATTGLVVLQDAAINSPDPSLFSGIFTAPADGTYYLGYHVVTVADASFSVDDILIDTAVLSVGEFSNAAISVFPNPAKTEVNIVGGTVNQVEVFNILGQKVMNATTNVLNVEELNAGVYILSVELDNGNKTSRKLIVE